MKRLMIYVGLVLLLAGCATTTGPGQPVVSKVITGDLAFLSSQGNRFAMYPAVNGTYLHGGEGSERIIAGTGDAIAKVMVAKGYVPVALHEHPDFIMGFGLGVESKISDDEIFEKAGLVVGLSTEGINQAKFQKGTALVAIFTPGSKEPRWRVLAQGLSNRKKSPEALQENIHQLMAAMLSPIPSVKSEPQ